jgi:hypothetical protein
MLEKGKKLHKIKKGKQNRKRKKRESIKAQQKKG